MTGKPWQGTYLPCDYCGKEIYVRPFDLKRSKHHFCSQHCQMEWLHGQFRKGMWRDALQEGQQQRYQGHRVEVTCPQCGHKRLIALADAKRGRKFCNNKCYLAWFRQYVKEHKEEWIAKSKHKGYLQPNKVEQELLNVLDAYFPNEWVYTGSGRKISINGMRPDFFNKNDRKEVIEVFGDYYHSSKLVKNSKWAESKRIESYGELGFSCLILWENEISELSAQEIADKIINFRRQYEQSNI